MLGYWPALLFLLSVSCSWDPKALQVGDYILRRSAVECRDAVITASFPEDKRKLGRDQLLQAYRHVQILKNFGREITLDQINAEKERVNQSTLTPQKLAQIKQACGGENSKAYEAAFLVPSIADRLIYYDFYLKTPGLHQESLLKAQKWKEKVATLPSQFESMAKQENVPISSFKVSLKKGLELHRAPAKSGNQIKETLLSDHPPIPHLIDSKFKQERDALLSQEGKKWIDEILNPLQPGQISEQVVDQGELLLVVKYLKPTPFQKDSYEIQAAVFPKRPYNEWLETEKQKVKLTILEKS
jgi:hypothetical protein